MSSCKYCNHPKSEHIQWRYLLCPTSVYEEAPKEEHTSMPNQCSLIDPFCSTCGTKLELRSIDVPGRAGPLRNHVCPKCFPWPVAEKTL